MGRGAVAVVLILTCYPTGDAGAEERPGAATAGDTFDALVAQGNEFLRSGRHAEALARFQRALALRQPPFVVFLVGRTHEALGNREAAFDYYRLYLGRVALDPSLLPPVPASSTPGVPSLWALAIGEVASELETRAHGRLAGGVLVGLLGAAALAVAATFFVKANQESSQPDCHDGCGIVPSFIGALSTLAGAALLGGGVALTSVSAVQLRRVKLARASLETVGFTPLRGAASVDGMSASLRFAF
jgi:hypothetical protein